MSFAGHNCMVSFSQYISFESTLEVAMLATLEGAFERNSNRDKLESHWEPNFQPDGTMNNGGLIRYCIHYLNSYTDLT